MQSSNHSYSFSKIVKIGTGVLSVWMVWFLSFILILRWVNPPFTSFTLQENWKELNAEPYDLSEEWVSYEKIPENIKWAVIASEDQRFWEHSGIDMVAITKAMEENEEGGRLRGASTISQQVAKNLFLWSGKSYFRKGLEAGITLSIEAFWPKERILEVYLNIAEFGPGVFGIGKASTFFFNKDASELTNDEAARMAVVLPNPKRMRVEPPSPFVAQRKDWVLRNMTQLSGIAYMPEAKPEVNYQDSLSISRVRYEILKPKMWLTIEDSAFYTDSLKQF